MNRKLSLADQTASAGGLGVPLEVRRVERTEMNRKSYSCDTPVGEDFHVS